MKVECVVVGKLQTNCYIVYDEKTMKGVVIDPGMEADKIISAIDRCKVDVKYILLTHGHFDHFLAANDVREHTGALVVIHEKDANKLQNPRLSMERLIRCDDVLTADITVSDGDEFTVSDIVFKFKLSPGHTNGSTVIFCGDSIFTGDTLFCGECGRCDFPTSSFEEMLSSLRYLYNLEGDYKIYPGHLEFTTLEQERRNNIYMHEAINR